MLTLARAGLSWEAEGKPLNQGCEHIHTYPPTPSPLQQNWRENADSGMCVPSWAPGQGVRLRRPERRSERPRKTGVQCSRETGETRGRETETQSTERWGYRGMEAEAKGEMDRSSQNSMELQGATGTHRQ